MMIERLIYSILHGGVADLIENPDDFHTLFQHVGGLAEEEIEVIREYFTTNPPSVIHNYPRQNVTFPLYAIVLKEERDTMRFLDESGGVLDVEDAEELYGDESYAGREHLVSIFRHSFLILTMTKHPDVALYYYYIAKLLLSRARNVLVDNGCFGIEMGGADLRPDPAYGPEHIFVRGLQISVQRPFAALLPATTPRPLRIDGIHIVGGDVWEDVTVRRNVRPR